MSDKSHRNSLNPGYRIQWYEIIKILGQGGFGITYLAKDLNLNQHVAIKEFLPIELAVRDGDHSIHPMSGDHGKQFEWGLDRFINEAQTLAKFDHPNIVRVLAVFEENNTAYMVMRFEEGESLSELLNPDQPGRQFGTTLYLVFFCLSVTIYGRYQSDGAMPARP